MIPFQNSTDLVTTDVKGVIGKEFYEGAAFLRNPIPDLA